MRKSLRNAGCWVVGAMVSVAASATNPGATAAQEPTALDRQVEERMREAGLVGLAGSILVDGKVVWTKGYGFADREAGLPFTADTIQIVASISKTVIGVALMRAVEAGKLRLDEDVNAYLPFAVRNPRYPDTPITLRQLATHTSGIADRDPVYANSYFQGGDSPVALGDFLRDYLDPKGKLYSADNFVVAKPGSSREYSNIGAGLAAYAIERAAGVPFAELTRNEIFRPLGMSQTGWFLSEIDRSRHAKLYDWPEGSKGTSPAAIPLYGFSTYPDGGLRTSVTELSRFFAMLLAGGELDGVRILERSSVDEMTRLQYTPANRPENVELAEKNAGIFWSTKMDVTYVGHGGSDTGVLGEMLAEPSKRVAVVLVTNTTPAEGTAQSFFAILRALIGRGRELVAEADAERRCLVAPGDAAQVRREIEAAYAANEYGFFARDADAVMKLRHPDFHTIDHAGKLSTRAEMDERTRSFIGRIEKFYGLRESVRLLELHGDTAIATVFQETSRGQQIPDGAATKLGTVETSVTQREWWRCTPTGWLLWRVDEVEPGTTLVDGKPPG